MHIGRWTLPAVLLGRGNLHVGTTHHAGHPKNRRHRPMQHQPRSSKSTTRWPAGPSAVARPLRRHLPPNRHRPYRRQAPLRFPPGGGGPPLRRTSPLACSVLPARRRAPSPQCRDRSRCDGLRTARRSGTDNAKPDNGWTGLSARSLSRGSSPHESDSKGPGDLGPWATADCS